MDPVSVRVYHQPLLAFLPACATAADPPATDNSTASIGIHVLSTPGAAYQTSPPADKTPSPVAANLLPQPLVSPGASNMSVASMVSPTTPLSADARRFDRPTSLESAPNSATLGGEHGGAESRRESVDSRMNQGFSDMRLGSSPYATHNHSTASIQNTLNTQRNPRPGLDALSIHRISNGYQPSAERNPEPHPKIGKTAPAITGPAQSTIARAAEPTKGQAWAFPEEEIQRIGPSSLYLDSSRRSSVTESIASSQFTTESRLPAGQRRLDESTDFNRLSSASSEFPPVHHHSLQHKQIGSLQEEDEEAGPTGSQPYSRTPELRVSHKLAERKRRTEMKELFEQLRDLMPQERGSKASKWEILTKGMEHWRYNFAKLLLRLTCLRPQPSRSISVKQSTFGSCSRTTTRLPPRSTFCAEKCRVFGWRTPHYARETMAVLLRQRPQSRNSRTPSRLPTGPSCHR